MGGRFAFCFYWLLVACLFELDCWIVGREDTAVKYELGVIGVSSYDGYLVVVRCFSVGVYACRVFVFFVLGVLCARGACVHVCVCVRVLFARCCDVAWVVRRSLWLG